MDILHVHTKGRKLDTLEQLGIYKHTKTHKDDILNEQTQFKSHHALFEHITPHTHKIDPSKAVSYTHLDVYKRQASNKDTVNTQRQYTPLLHPPLQTNPLKHTTHTKTSKITKIGI